jgi:DNA-3-methyladenine glycosylase II
MTLLLTPKGPFSLRASSRFVEGFPAGQGGSTEGTHLDLAFPVDGSWQPVGVRISQDDRGVHATLAHDPDGAGLATVEREVTRILSLDVDGSGFAAVGERDPVVRRLQARFPGLRPVQFHTPYEAAAWAVLGHRIRMTQAAALRRRLSARHGVEVPIDGRTFRAFPAPAAVVALDDLPELPRVKADRLRAVATAALDGRLDAAALRAVPREEALAGLREIPGIGPFSAELVLLRGAGDADAFPRHEPRLHRAMRAVYGLDADAPVQALRDVADRWRPYRTWVALLLRTWLEQETGEIATGRRAGQLPQTVTLAS